MELQCWCSLVFLGNLDACNARHLLHMLNIRDRCLTLFETLTILQPHALKFCACLGLLQSLQQLVKGRQEIEGGVAQRQREKKH